jgi:hypothetical protein
LFSFNYPDEVFIASPLSIPGIITVGPYVSIDAALALMIGAKGKILALTSQSWSQISGTFDLINDAQSSVPS